MDETSINSHSVAGKKHIWRIDKMRMGVSMKIVRKILQEKSMITDMTDYDVESTEQNRVVSEDRNTELLEGATADDEVIIALLKKYRVNYVDKRSKGGALWIIGGNELKSVVSQSHNLGFEFTFKEMVVEQLKIELVGGQNRWLVKLSSIHHGIR